MRRRGPERGGGSPTAVLLDLALVAAALLGAVVLLWRIAAAALGLELVEFATGSMTPVYPQGSLAVAQRTPLDQVRTGDVVTVDRGPSALPITHRVVSLTLLDGGRSAHLRLKGDANTVEDPTTYRVTGLDRVVAGLPPALGGLRALNDPMVGGTSALVAAGAVGWAVWPHRSRRGPARHRLDTRRAVGA